MKFKKSILFSSILLIVASIFLMTGCNNTQVADKAPTGKHIKVLTTIPPLYSLTANLIEGTDTELTNLIPANVSVHTYQLTPQAVKTLSESDIVVMNGLQVEEFLNDAIQNTDALIVDSSQGVDLLKSLEFSEEDGNDEHDDEEEHDGHGEYDPHIWLSTTNAKIQIKNIVKALKEKDPENAEIYEANFISLSKKLDDLHEEMLDGFNALDMGNYIVFHDAYQYFEHDYGVRSIAALEEFAGQEPSPEYLKNVITLIKENNVVVAFTEPQFSPKLLKTLSDDYKLKSAALDPLGQEVSKDAYFKLLRSNLETFRAVFPKK